MIISCITVNGGMKAVDTVANVVAEPLVCLSYSAHNSTPIRGYKLISNA